MGYLKRSDLEGAEVNLADVQHLVGLSRQHLQRLIDDGKIDPERNGTNYRLSSLVKSIVAHYQESAREAREGKAGDLKEAKVRF